MDEDEVMPCSPNMCTLAKENNEIQNLKENQSEPAILSSEEIDNRSQKENQNEPSNLFDQAHSSSSLETYLAKFLPEGSTVEVETSVESGKYNPRKRRQLILLDDDDEEKAEEVQPENSDPLCQCDTPNKNNDIEKATQTGDLSNSNPSDGGTMKKRRRYIDASEDEDDAAVIDVANVSSAEKDVENCALNDDGNLEPQTAVAEDHPLRSRIPSDSYTSDPRYCTYSRPRDEPVWSGVYKINSEVFGQLDAYLSNKACQKVWDLSRMLQPVVEVMKLPRLQAWPRKWMSAAPTDDSIGLFFFPRSSRPNEESNKLLNNIIESDDALEVTTIGVAELLIFSSTLLPEQNKLFQGKYFLWGVFKRIKDKSNRGVLVGEQDGLACATEECNVREQHLLYQQDDIRCESAGQETPSVKYVKHAENEIVVEHNCLAQNAAIKMAKREGITLTDSNLPSGKPNSSEGGPKCSLHPRIDHEFHAPEKMNQHLSAPVLNASSVSKSTTECGHGESYSASGPSTTKLFGLFTARTPRGQQLIQEMISEGAVVISAPE